MGTLGNIILPCPVIILWGPKFDPKSLELHESFFVLQNCDLSGCDLQEANLRGSNVKGAIFEEMLTPLHMSQSVRWEWQELEEDVPDGNVSLFYFSIHQIV